MGEGRQIFCSTCNVAAEAIVNPDRDTRVSCPRCGREDNLDKTVAAAVEYQLDQVLRSALGGGSSVKVSVNGGPNTKPGFVFRD